jgi:predicted small integral membrane protein
MKLSWTILAMVATVNLFWIWVMFMAQQFDKSLPARHSIIPWSANQKFLHMQDYWTMTWGDIFGVALMNTAFVHLAWQGYFNVKHWIIFAGMVITFAIQFMRMCKGPDHKPDMGFPRAGKISWIGMLHLPYFGIGMTTGLFCFWFAIYGKLRGPVLHIFLIGAAVYAVCFIAEINSGNFDPLKPMK